VPARRPLPRRRAALPGRPGVRPDRPGAAVCLRAVLQEGRAASPSGGSPPRGARGGPTPRAGAARVARADGARGEAGALAAAVQRGSSNLTRTGTHTRTGTPSLVAGR